MRDKIAKQLLQMFLIIRWSYFHVHPGYKKFYMDSNKSESHFFHAKSNTIHCNYKVT